MRKCPTIATDGLADQVRAEPSRRGLGTEDRLDLGLVVRGYGAAQEEPNVGGQMIRRRGLLDLVHEGRAKVRAVLHPLGKGFEHETFGICPEQDLAVAAITVAATSIASSLGATPAPPPSSTTTSRPTIGPTRSTGGGSGMTMILLIATDTAQPHLSKGLNDVLAHRCGGILDQKLAHRREAPDIGRLQRREGIHRHAPELLGT
mmetsp:Transcript_32445/g.95629  ORF Transcript_32445/g.95629 Transcript_32445/m.95629 type:complete len:204 (-) Transcript_32445:689-1300(-)